MAKIDQANAIIEAMWYALGNLPCSRCDFLGDDLYDEVADYIGWNEDDADDDDFIDSEIEDDDEIPF
jgi:hypothetical protein